MYFIFLVPLFCFVKYMFTNCAKKSSKIKAIFRSSPPKIIGGYNFKAWTWVSITKWQSKGNVQILVFSRNTNIKNQAPYKIELYMRYDCGQSITSFQAKQFVKSELTWLKLKCPYQGKNVTKSKHENKESNKQIKKIQTRRKQQQYPLVA